MKFFWRKNQIMKQTLSWKVRFWIENNSTVRFWIENCSFRMIFENKNFRIIIFQSKTNFEKSSFEFGFWEAIFRWEIHVWKNSFWLSLLPRKQPNFHFPFLFQKAWFSSKSFHWKLKISVWNDVILEKKSDYEANFFLENEILNLNFFDKSDYELRIYRPGRYRKQYFSNIGYSEKNYILKNQVLSSVFEKEDFVEKFICEKNHFDSVCSTDGHRFFTFLAYFKKHDSEAILFIENQCLKGSSFEKKSDYEANFFLEKEVLNWNFFNKSDFELSFFRRRRFLKTKFFE